MKYLFHCRYPKQMYWLAKLTACIEFFIVTKTSSMFFNFLYEHLEEWKSEHYIILNNKLDEYEQSLE